MRIAITVFVVVASLFLLSLELENYANAQTVQASSYYTATWDVTHNIFTYTVQVQNNNPSLPIGYFFFDFKSTGTPDLSSVNFVSQPSGWTPSLASSITYQDTATPGPSAGYIPYSGWGTFVFTSSTYPPSTLPFRTIFVSQSDGLDISDYKGTASCGGLVGSSDVPKPCITRCYEVTENIDYTVTCPAQPSSQSPTLNEGTNQTPVPLAIQNSSVTVKTDKQTYQVGDTLTVSGTASPVSANPVAIQIFGPSNNLVRNLYLSLDSTGVYSWPLSVSTALFPNSGTYTIKASYEGASAQTTFTFVNNTPITTCPPDYVLVNGQCVVGTTSQTSPAQPGQGNYTITVSTDKSSYIVGDMVKISGIGTPDTNSPVTIQVLDPSGNLVHIYNSAQVLLILQPSGAYFTQTGVTVPPFETNGVYTVKATYQGATAQTTFSITNIPSTTTSPQCPGTIFPNGQCVIYSGGRCLDQFGNAITGGVTIQNDQCVPLTQGMSASSGNQTGQIIITQGSGQTGSTCASTNSCLEPTILTIVQGQTVTWVNNDSMSHTVTSGKPTDASTGTVFDSGMLGEGKSFSFTFDSTGTFYYFDQVHPWIIGQVIVEPSGTGGATAPLVIPSWIKNNAKWWSAGQVSDDDFIKGMQYLIDNGMMQLNTETTGNYSIATPAGIPSWVKNNAKWWSAGQVSDDEFVRGMQYLANHGIIHVDKQTKMIHYSTPKPKGYCANCH